MKSYSQTQLDIKMLPYLEHIENGFFIECGANDGIAQSNTLIYEVHFGWRGLLIEPNISKFKKCIVHRQNSIVENFALVSDKHKGENIKGFFQFDDYENSLCGQVLDRNERVDIEGRWRGKDAIDVPAITLTKLLQKHKIQKVDFFSLDVENYEIEVLSGIDFSLFQIDYILVEIGFLEDKKHVDLLLRNYENIDTLTKNDFLYKRKDV